MYTINSGNQSDKRTQSIWLDSVRRKHLMSGEFTQLVEAEEAQGGLVASMMAEKLFIECECYDEHLRHLAQSGFRGEEVYRMVTMNDVRMAARTLERVYRRSGGRDGYVSCRIDPRLARNSSQVINQARRLWRSLDAPNLLLEVAATRAGVEAIEELVASGINVHATFVLTTDRYRQVANAYMSGLERRLEDGVPIDHVALTASFCVGSFDEVIDTKLESNLSDGASPSPLRRSPRPDADKLLGRGAIAQARLLHEAFDEITGSDRFGALAAHGAIPPRLVWADTRPAGGGDNLLRHVDALPVRDTIAILDEEMLVARRARGSRRVAAPPDVEQARRTTAALAKAGVSLDLTAATLFEAFLDESMATVDRLFTRLDSKLQHACCASR